MKTKLKMVYRSDRDSIEFFEVIVPNMVTVYKGAFWCPTPNGFVTGVFSKVAKDNKLEETAAGRVLAMWSANPLGMNAVDFMAKMGFKIELKETTNR